MKIFRVIPEELYDNLVKRGLIFPTVCLCPPDNTWKRFEDFFTFIDE